MARAPNTQPTEVELEILKVLWDVGPAGLGRVHEVLNVSRAVAMTTVATMLKTMTAKRLVRRDDGAKGYAYSALLGREAATTGMVGKLLDHVFDGSAKRLVAHLLRDGTLDDRARREVIELLSRADGPGTEKGGRP